VDKLSNGKPQKKDMDEFKSYYEKMYKKLIEYIQFTKNKVLSEKAKELPILKQLFSTFNTYMAILILIMITPLALIVYLYTLSELDNLIYTIIGVDIIIVFFLVRKIQKESTTVITRLSKAKPIVKVITKMIESS